MLLHELGQLLRGLRTQKLRAFLTGFGLVWGTLSVTLMLAFGEGLHRQMIVNQKGLGDNIVIAWPSRTSLSFEGLPKGRPLRLTAEDSMLLRTRAQTLRAVSAEFRRELKVHAAERTLSTNVHGVETAFGAMRSLRPQPGGRFLNALDEERRRRVAFIGDELARELFGDPNPVGRTIAIGASPFLVIGVLEPKNQDGNYSGPDESKVFVPASTFRATTGARFVDNLVFRAKSAAMTPEAKEEVYTLLGAKHRFDPSDEEALLVWDTTEGFAFLDAFGVAFRLFLGVIGSLTLIVGGIGVSNIMHVVVEERTREIGIRMALGARPLLVMRPLLLETALIALVAGGIGIGLAALVCAVFPALGAGDFVGTPRISLASGLLSATLLAAIALVAGWFPARHAARLDPVVAMKTE